MSAAEWPPSPAAGGTVPGAPSGRHHPSERVDRHRARLERRARVAAGIRGPASYAVLRGDGGGHPDDSHLGLGRRLRHQLHRYEREQRQHVQLRGAGDQRADACRPTQTWSKADPLALRLGLGVNAIAGENSVPRNRRVEDEGAAQPPAAGSRATQPPQHQHGRSAALKVNSADGRRSTSRSTAPAGTAAPGAALLGVHGRVPARPSRPARRLDHGPHRLRPTGRSRRRSRRPRPGRRGLHGPARAGPTTPPTTRSSSSSATTRASPTSIYGAAWRRSGVQRLRRQVAVHFNSIGRRHRRHGQGRESVVRPSVQAAPLRPPRLVHAHRDRDRRLDRAAGYDVSTSLTGIWSRTQRCSRARRPSSRPRTRSTCRPECGRHDLGARRRRRSLLQRGRTRSTGGSGSRRARPRAPRTAWRPVTRACRAAAPTRAASRRARGAIRQARTSLRTH